MKPKTIISSKHLQHIINRLCYELIENHDDFSRSVLIGLQPRGTYVADRIHQRLKELLPDSEIKYGNLDVTFFRDDFRRREQPLKANATHINFLIEEKNVILVDDVLFTGRTTRAGLDALMAFGRPESVELLVLIDRRFSRHLPIQPDYIGKTVDSVASERVQVMWKETDGKDKVIMFTTNTAV